MGEGSGVREALVEGLVNELPGDSLMIDIQSMKDFNVGFYLIMSAKSRSIPCYPGFHTESLL